MDAEKERPQSNNLGWQVVALIGIGVASWTVRTTFRPERYRYQDHHIGDYHRIIRIDKETDEVKTVYPKPSKPTSPP